MATAAEALRAYREQAGLDGDEAIALLVDFVAGYGMTGGATDVLCEYIDDEGLRKTVVANKNGRVLVRFAEHEPIPNPRSLDGLRCAPGCTEAGSALTPCPSQNEAPNARAGIH